MTFDEPERVDLEAHIRHLQTQLRRVSIALGNDYTEASYEDLAVQVMRLRVNAETLARIVERDLSIRNEDTCPFGVRASLLISDIRQNPTRSR